MICMSNFEWKKKEEYIQIAKSHGGRKHKPVEWNDSGCSQLNTSEMYDLFLNLLHTRHTHARSDDFIQSFQSMKTINFLSIADCPSDRRRGEQKIYFAAKNISTQRSNETASLNWICFEILRPKLKIPTQISRFRFSVQYNYVNLFSIFYLYFRFMNISHKFCFHSFLFVFDFFFQHFKSFASLNALNTHTHTICTLNSFKWTKNEENFDTTSLERKQTKWNEIEPSTLFRVSFWPKI